MQIYALDKFLSLRKIELKGEHIHISFFFLKILFIREREGGRKRAYKWEEGQREGEADFLLSRELNTGLGSIPGP